MSGHSFSFTSIRCHAYLFKFVYCCIRKGSFDGHSTYKHSLHIYLNSFLTNYNLQMSFYTPSMVFRSCMFSEIDVFTNFILLFRSYLSVSTCTSRVHDRCELFNTAEFIPLSIVASFRGGCFTSKLSIKIGGVKGLETRVQWPRVWANLTS